MDTMSISARQRSIEATLRAFVNAMADDIPGSLLIGRLMPVAYAARAALDLDQAERCTYPNCKCIVGTSTTVPEPKCARGLERAAPVETAQLAALGLIDRQTKALKIAAAAFHALPKIGEPYGPQHRTANAAALVLIQAAVAMAEGRPFDPLGCDLIQILEGARDTIDAVLPLADFISPRELKRGEETLHALVQLVGASAPPFASDTIENAAGER